MRAGWRQVVGVLTILALQSCTQAGEAERAASTASSTSPVVSTSTTGSSGTETAEPPEPELLLHEGPINHARLQTVVIANMKVTNPDGDCINITGVRQVIIRNSEIGPCGGRAVEIRNSSNVTIEDTKFLESAAGVYVLRSEGVQIRGNTFTSTGRNPIQFDKVTGAGNAITDNVILNENGNDETEDSINIFMSGGLPDDPLVVARNVIEGGGSSTTGSGIIIGDAGGSNTVVESNLLIDPGQVGIGVAGGANITVRGNTVFAGAHPWSNVGIYVWNQADGPCGQIRVEGNVVEFYNSAGELSTFFDGENCGVIEGWDANSTVTDLEGRLEELRRELLGRS
ncbi:MAG TPA: right-handed parallel beta-helix repeat-containing protein [Acidimicrobiia bacterium]